MEPTVSLCMIVKDEEDLLPRCLESVREYVDEIILVDTGSTDSSVEIAESFGAKVYNQPWEDDFSQETPSIWRQMSWPNTSTSSWPEDS